jgi:calcineurin-like phosphoesterase family protein
MNYFTSDLHFNHDNIIKYCNRPFKNAQEMNEKIIENWNNIVKPEDTVFHLGDFLMCGGDYHEFEKRLNGKIIFIKGNHDKRLTKAVESITFKHDKYTIFMKHILNFHEMMGDSIPKDMDFILVGHVHDIWKSKLSSIVNIKGHKVFMINVGVDQWDFKPITMDEIINYWKEIKKETV